MMFFFLCVVDGVGLVSIIDEIVCVFPTNAEQTCRHDKMRHVLREEACFKCNDFCDWQPSNFDSPQRPTLI